MFRAMHSAATGMNAMQLQIDNISNNLANVNTTAFKKNRMSFQDLMYQTLYEAGRHRTEDIKTPTGLQVGNGVQAVGNSKVYSMGALDQTGKELDLAIVEKAQGNVSFFTIQMADGSFTYTRAGDFSLSDDGTIVTQDGFVLDPGITIPEGTLEIQIAQQGTVLALTKEDEAPEEVGQIELARFVNPDGLKAVGKNLFIKTAASGEPIIGSPGEDSFGTILQGSLESSNIQVVEEMVKMIQAQRSYELDSKAIQTAEDMLGIANNLRR